MPDNYKGPVKAPDASLKKMIRVKRKNQGLTYQLDGNIDTVINRLIQLRDSTPEGSELELAWEAVYAQYPGEDDSAEVVMYDNRLETDQECRIRLQKAEQAVLDKRATQMAQLAHLKKELGEIK